ncbi:MAG: NAD(P)H-dependent oxidoreductase subunit E [Candidatus Omnitrophica bacterium]|nr:NAD(P)H-dependent oxidoreductase subunit E [Candidatus Omnitrophota bacterium]
MGPCDDKSLLRPYKRHILVCTGPRCAPEISPEVYTKLKDKIKELGLNDGPERINRSQCHCFGVCQQGPIAVVYPEGVWYHEVTWDKMQRIVKEHLIDGHPVEEYIFHRLSNQK